MSGDRILGGLALMIGGIGAALGLARRQDGAGEAATAPDPVPARVIVTPQHMDRLHSDPGDFLDPDPVPPAVPTPAPAPAPSGFAQFAANASEREVVARTAWGEARSEGRGGMAAVIHVIRNRADRRVFGGSTARSVSLAPFQFSVWNGDDRNRRASLAVTESDPHYRVALALYDRIILERRDDDVPASVLTATHYFVSNTRRPSWANKLPRVGQYKAHTFYREERGVA